MYKASTIVAAGLAAARLANAQSAIPIITGGSGGSNGACGGCYVVADVAGIAFGSETNTATATNQVVVVNGLNSTYTTTSIIFEQGDFTFAPMTIHPTQTSVAAQATPLNIGTSTFVVNGVTLTSPTAYNVFTAYSITSYIATNGGCQIVANPASQVSPAFSVAIPEGVDYNSFALEAESSFIDFLGVPTCSAAGENLTPTAIIPQTVATITATTTSSASLTARPAISRSSAGGPTGPTTSAAPSPFATFIPNANLPNASSSVYLAGGTGTIFIPGPSASGKSIQIAGAPSATIQIAGADRARQAGSLLAGAAALLMGFVA